MNRKRFNEGQIIGILKESEAITVEMAEIPVNAMRFWSRRTGVIALHPVRQADTECVGGELQRQVTGPVPERAVGCGSGRCWAQH